jgi:hypothetical protein
MICGLYLLYVSLFTYEAGNGLQNRLEEFWIRVDDRGTASIDRNTAFLRETAAMTRKSFDRLLGERLISFRAVGICAACSLASAIICVRCLGEPAPSLAFAGFLVLSATSIGAVKSRRATGFLVAVACIATIAPFAISVFTPIYTAIRFIELMVGALLDVIFVTINRRMLSSVGRRGALAITGAIALNLLFALLLVGPVIAIELVRRFPSTLEAGFNALLCLPPGPVGFVGRVGLTNFFTALAAMSSVIVASVAIAHRLFWPAISRLTYSLAEMGLLKDRRKVAAVGLGLISLGFVRMGPLIERMRGLLQ